MDKLNLNERVIFRKPFQKISAYISGIFFTILTLTNGYVVFTKGNWSVSGFFTSYITVGYVLVLFIASTIYYREWKFKDIESIRSELVPKIDEADEEERNEVAVEPKTWYGKLGNKMI